VLVFDVKKKVLGINESWAKTSSIYFDKKAKAWIPKQCLITLGMIKDGKYTKIGSSKEINVADFIDQGPVTRIFEYNQLAHPLQYVKIRTTMLVTSADGARNTER
jgi:hypothetical protein